MTDHDDLPRDPALSRRYREAAEAADTAPPPAMDALILKAAREAVQPAAKPAAPAWWRRLTLPVGIAATAMLAVMLALTMQRQTPETQLGEAAAPAAQAGTKPAPAVSSPLPAAAKAPMQSDMKPAAPAAERADSALPAAPVRAERAAPAAAVVEKKVAPAPVGAAAPTVSMPAPASADAALPPPVVQQAAPVAPASNEAANDASRRKSEAVSNRAAGSAAEAASPARLQKALPAASDTSAREAPVDAQAWIAEIRELKRQGRDDEAARRLVEFRRAYPEYVLPEDLK